MMTDSSNDTGVIMTLLERLEKYRLPRAQALKDKVDGGAVLDDEELAFLKQVYEDGQQIHGMLKRHPEYQPLATKVTQLFTEIMRKATANASSDPS
jgi:hypothetical protein